MPPVFLLSDIEGSTRLWEHHRQAMLAALLRHNQVLEAQIGQHGGRILERRGDGVKAVFEGSNPLPAAIAVQRQFGQEDWGEIGQLRIRLGLHGGPGLALGHDYFQEGEQYFGPALNTTARIMDAAWGGQILLSEQVHAGFPLPDGAAWQDFGRHELRGVAEPVHIFGLCHPDLPQQTFPPLRTLPAESEPPLRPTLPAPPTPFVGREAELAALDAFLANRQTRLITIVAPGGMGKTRLALAAAARQLERAEADGAGLFPHGVFFVSLAPLNSPEQILPALAQALGLPRETAVEGRGQPRGQGALQTPARSPQQQLLDFLRQKELLLVMDNFEHLLPGAALLADILETAPGVTILVTARERLHLPQEQVFPLQGLALPQGEEAGEALQATAVRLFLQSARRLRPDFALAEGDLPALVRLCRQVAGMPLGLELAASWVESLSLTDIAAELQRSLDLLEGQASNVLERHRSLRAIFDASWQRFSPEERAVFPQLAVFRGGFTRSAAQAVTGASLRVLASLGNKLLLTYDQGRDRYEMHPLLRQYAAEKLAASPEAEAAARERHSATICATLAALEKSLKGPGRQAAIIRIAPDVENAHYAWKWAAKQGEIDRVAQAMPSLCLFYWWHNRHEEGESACRRVTDALQAGGPLAPEGRRVLALALGWQASFALALGRAAEGQALLARGQALLDEEALAGLDTRRERAFFLARSGMLAANSGQYAQARRQLEQSLALYQELEDWWEVANILELLGHQARKKGDFQEARRWFARSLALSRSQGSIWQTANELRALGWVARELNHYDLARQRFEESVSLCSEQGDARGLAESFQALGYLDLFLGHFERGTRLLQQGLNRLQESGDRIGMGYGTINLGLAHLFAGRGEAALALVQRGVGMQVPLENPVHIAYARQTLAVVLAHLGRYEAARTQAHLARGLARAIAHQYLLGWDHRVLAWLEAVGGDYAHALELAHASAANFESVGDQEQVAWSLAAVALAAHGLGRAEEARAHLGEALALASAIQAFIPLLYLLPAASLILAGRGQGELAAELFALAQSQPLVATSPLFADLVGRRLQESWAASPALAAAQERGRARQWWPTVAELRETGLF